MKEYLKRKLYWRKLDDQAKVFSLASNGKYSSVFRLSVILKEKVNSEILQKALELALDKYQAYKVRMRHGFFWYYLENNDKSPIIREECEYPFQKVNTGKNNNYLFKVTYFENKINIDFFHALTDGNSGGDFFKEIIYKYLELKYPKDFEKIDIDEEIIEDSENAYKKNYKKVIKKRKSLRRAFKIKGTKLSQGTIAINHFNIDLNEIKTCTKQNDSTITMFLIAMIAYSIYDTNYKLYNGKRPINICVPINLKKYLQTDTISNFFSYMMVSIRIKRDKKYTFEDILQIVKREFDRKLKLEKMLETISSDAGSTNNIFIRILPLVLKKIAVRIGSLQVKRRTTLTFSNIGKIDIEEKYHKYIEKCFVILSPDWAETIKCGICSYENNLAVTFGTILKESIVERKFKELLEINNIHYNIEGNGVNML